jgi:hypothetical protein
VNRSDLLHTDS